MAGCDGRSLGLIFVCLHRLSGMGVLLKAQRAFWGLKIAAYTLYPLYTVETISHVKPPAIPTEK